MYRAKEKSTNSPKAVHFFQHFPSNFLRPYGLADNVPQESTIFRRVAPLNCEWLLRPRVAASEFAETIEQNLKLLAESDSKLINRGKFENIQDKLSTFNACLQKFNTLNDEGNATANDVKHLLKTILSDDDELDNFFDSMFKLGGAMYLLGVHYTIVKTILSNPEWFANRNAADTVEAKQFLRNATIKGMKDYLTATCAMSETTTQTKRTPTMKRNLAALLDFDSDDDRDQPCTSAAHHPPPQEEAEQHQHWQEAQQRRQAEKQKDLQPSSGNTKSSKKRKQKKQSRK